MRRCDNGDDGMLLWFYRVIDVDDDDDDDDDVEPDVDDDDDDDDDDDADDDDDDDDDVEPDVDDDDDDDADADADDDDDDDDDADDDDDDDDDDIYFLEWMFYHFLVPGLDIRVWPFSLSSLCSTGSEMRWRVKCGDIMLDLKEANLFKPCMVDESWQQRSYVANFLT